jgi:hypothetical protein
MVNSDNTLTLPALRQHHNHDHILPPKVELTLQRKLPIADFSKKARVCDIKECLENCFKTKLTIGKFIMNSEDYIQDLALKIVKNS